MKTIALLALLSLSALSPVSAHLDEAEQRECAYLEQKKKLAPDSDDLSVGMTQAERKRLKRLHKKQ